MQSFLRIGCITGVMAPVNIPDAPAGPTCNSGVDLEVRCLTYFDAQLTSNQEPEGIPDNSSISSRFRPYPSRFTSGRACLRLTLAHSPQPLRELSWEPSRMRFRGPFPFSSKRLSSSYRFQSVNNCFFQSHRSTSGPGGVETPLVKLGMYRCHNLFMTRLFIGR